MLLLLSCDHATVDSSKVPSTDTNTMDTAPGSRDTDTTAPDTGPTPVHPSEAAGTWTWAWHDPGAPDATVTLTLDAANGARITGLTVGTVAVLSTVDATNFGSTFWTSPQSDWGWPPVAAIDTGAYTAALDGDTLVLTSAPATVGDATVTVEKRVSVDTAGVTLAYTVRNVGDTQATLAGWEVTRVATGGLTFFPAGASTTSTVGTFPSHVSGGIVWFDGAPSPAGDTKLVADGAQGWLAHVTGGVLLLQTFADLAPADTAPGEGEIELFAAANYIELENQGAYTPLAPGASLTHTVHWQVTTLPTSIPVAVGSGGLTAFVRAQL
jgi:hypothetical protein